MRSQKLLEVLSALKDSGGHREIFIAPPDDATGDITEGDSGDSGDEDDCHGPRLPGHVLHASVVPEDSDSTEEEEEEEKKMQPSNKRQKIAVDPQRVWTKRDIQSDFSSWTASDPHLEALKSKALSPVGLFELFFDEGTTSFIVKETNHYARLKNVTLDLTAQELKCILGIFILSGYTSYPRRKLFWETAPDSCHRLVANAIRRKRFEQIFPYLHLADDSEGDESDALAKARPLIVHMNSTFQKHAPLDEFYSFGESVYECFGHRGSRLLHAGKAPRLGHKMWCGTTSRGYLVWFEPRQGALPAEPHGGLDVGGSMAVSFVEVLQKRGLLPYHVLFHGVSASIQLASILRRKGVKATGAVCEESVEQCPLKDPRELRKMKRGSFDYRVDEREEVIVCRWQNGSVVNICSNAVGIEPVRLSTCQLGAANPRAQVRQPSLVKLYQEKGRGVARMAQNIARYQVQMQGMRWDLSFIGFLIDAALNNAWQLSRLCCPGSPVDLLAFRRHVACAYLESFGSPPVRPGRRAVTASRFDMIGHWIIQLDRPTRCTLCHSQTNTRCEKCQKGLHARCFKEYHTRRP